MERVEGKIPTETDRQEFLQYLIGTGKISEKIESYHPRHQRHIDWVEGQLKTARFTVKQRSATNKKGYTLVKKYKYLRER